MNRPTRFYSSRQEKQVAKTIGGKQVSNSGATTYNKGDVTTDIMLVECKTCVQPKKSFTIQKQWLEKNEEEAFEMGKPYNCLAFDFGDGKINYIISEKLFLKLLGCLQEETK